jgi:hypothetical protein
VSLPCFVRHKRRACPDPALILRRANVSRKGGSGNTKTGNTKTWQHEDYDVFDGEREVGRVYLVDGRGGRESWFWGVSFQVTKRKTYGYAISLEEAKAAFRVEYAARKGTQK